MRRPINRWVRGTRAAARAFRMEWSRTPHSVGHFLTPLYRPIPCDEKWSVVQLTGGGGGGGGGGSAYVTRKWVPKP